MNVAVRVLSILVATAASAAAQPYSVVELPCLPGTFRAFVSDINERLEIVGNCDDQVVVWGPAGVRPIGLVGRQPLFINNRSVVSGTRMVGGERQLFEWANGVFRRLPQPPGVLGSLRARTENDILLVDTDLATWAILGETVYNLSAITGAVVSGVNELGTIAGQLNGAPYLRFLDGRTVFPMAGTNASLQQIGASGHFAGVFGGALSRRFFVGTPDGTATPVTMADLRFVGVSDINRRGEFVGFGGILAGLLSAFVYGNGVLTALDTALDAPYTLLSSNAISDAGVIAAVGRRIGGGPIVALALIPTPPFAPQNVAFTLNGRNVTLGWQPSVGALDYILEAGTSPGATNAFNGNIGAAPGLSVAAPPGRYYVRVRARNAIGIGPASAEVIIDVP